MSNTIMTEFEHHLTDQDTSPHTVQGYLGDVRQFIAWFEQTNHEAFTLEGVTPTDIYEYRAFLQVTAQRKANTINRHLAAISSLMNWAKLSGKISDDPTENVKGVMKLPLAPKWLDRKEQYDLQRAIEEDLRLSKLRYPKRWVTRRRDASLVQFLLNTGLRLNEATSLRLSDVTLTERKGSVLVHWGKGGKQRTVPLNAEARRALEAWLEVRPQGDSDHVWVAVEDTEADGLSSRAVQRVMKRYAQDAGLDELTPLITRHTFAKNLINQGVGIEKVAALLGHSNLNTTRMYIDPNENDLEQAVGKLQRAAK